MRRLFKVLGVLLGVAALGIGGFLAKIQFSAWPHYPTQKVDLKVEATPERIANGKKWASMLCAGCHMNVQTGKLSGADMHIDDPFGRIYSYNITRHPTAGIGSWTDGELAFLLRTGIARDGRYTPPWMAKLPNMSDEDFLSVIAFIRSDDPMLEATDVASIPAKPTFFSKFLATVAFKPYPYPTAPIPPPNRGDPVALGRYLVHNADCYTCHSADFAKLDPLDPPKSAGYFGGGNVIEHVTSANLTMDPETGIGKWSEDDFVRALREGVRPDNTAVQYPMTAYSMLTFDEAKAIYAYLKTVPVLKNAVKRTPPPAITPEMSAGKKVYTKYACTGCHGEGGMATCDLTHTRAHFATDEDLVAFIREPSAQKPGSLMPTWKNVIKDEEMAALVAHVRSLDRTAPGDVKQAGGSR